MRVSEGGELHQLPYSCNTAGDCLTQTLSDHEYYDFLGRKVFISLLQGRGANCLVFEDQPDLFLLKIINM